MKIAIVDNWRFATGQEAQFLLRLNRSTKGWWWRNCHQQFDEIVLPRILDRIRWKDIDRYFPTIMVLGVGKTIFVPPDTLVRVTGGGRVEGAAWSPDDMEPPIGFCLHSIEEVIETWRAINDSFVRDRMSN